MNDSEQLEKGKKLLAEDKYDDAFVYLLECAIEGNAEARSIVGLMYYIGQGTKRDLNESIKWLNKAIKQGRGDAAHNLATLYLTCEPDLPANPEEARRLYLKARDLGFVVAPDDWYNKLK